jgi:hypothetical protein
VRNETQLKVNVTVPNLPSLSEYVRYFITFSPYTAKTTPKPYLHVAVTVQARRYVSSTFATRLMIRADDTLPSPGFDPLRTYPVRSCSIFDYPGGKLELDSLRTAGCVSCIATYLRYELELTVTANTYVFPAKVLLTRSGIWLSLHDDSATAATTMPGV